jgi:hypothetical protein
MPQDDGEFLGVRGPCEDAYSHRHGGGGGHDGQQCRQLALTISSQVLSTALGLMIMPQSNMVLPLLGALLIQRGRLSSLRHSWNSVLPRIQRNECASRLPLVPSICVLSLRGLVE